MYVLVHHNYKLTSNNILELNGYQTIIKRNKITIMSSDLIDEFLKAKYEPALNRLLSKIIAYLDSDEDDDDSAGAPILLDELARERALLLNKYEKYLSPKEINRYMKSIRLLATELKLRIYQYNMTTNYHKRK